MSTSFSRQGKPRIPNRAESSTGRHAGFARLILLSVLCATSALALEQETGDGFVWNLPAGFHAPPVPADNPMTPVKVELGRYLFYDLRMSVNGKGSCSTCHIQAYGFTDLLPVAIGATGQAHPRRSMPLANVGWFAVFTWANPTITKLEDQSSVPLFNDHPVELGLKRENDSFLQVIATDPTYAKLFPEAFPGDAGPYSFVHVRKALAAFERTLISGNSAYDRYRYGHQANAISESAKRGEDLFSHQPLACTHCHGGFTLGSETVYSNGESPIDDAFDNNGLYNRAGQFTYPAGNLGLYEVTHDLADVGKFRPPSLRNVAVRAPYMHDGSLKTLDDVLDSYARGGHLIAGGPNAGDGSKNPSKSHFVAGFKLSPQDRADLKAFLESLTDEEFLHDPKFSNPWPQSFRQDSRAAGTGQ
jgi:cytochrome c peroxidase